MRPTLRQAFRALAAERLALNPRHATDGELRRRLAAQMAAAGMGRLEDHIDWCKDCADRALALRRATMPAGDDARKGVSMAYPPTIPPGTDEAAVFADLENLLSEASGLLDGIDGGGFEREAAMHIEIARHLAARALERSAAASPDAPTDQDDPGGQDEDPPAPPPPPPGDQDDGR